MSRAKYKAVYVDLEGGFWGLTDVDDNKFFIVNMPEQLKLQGGEFTVTLKIFDGASMTMWGTPAEVISFSTS